jgi:hypothetical protein
MKENFSNIGPRPNVKEQGEACIKKLFTAVIN